jgi:hypothetical protein
MINNTLTLAEHYDIPSDIQDYNPDENITDESLCLEESIDALDYLRSVELRRIKIKNDLSEYFNFENESLELEYLENNSELIDILPSIAQYIKNNFDHNAKLTLELLNESADWQTLFINIYSCTNWEKTNYFVDTFLENMYELYPLIAEKINLNVIPDEF